MKKKRKSRCLFLTNYFYPEDFKGNDIVAHLSEQGYDVTVITNIPNYPQGRFYKGYSIFKRRSEVVYGAKVYRAFTIPRGNGNKYQLLLNYISGAFSIWLYTLFFALFKPKFDIVIVQQLSPIFIGIPAITYKTIRKTPVLYWLLDLWPDSLAVTGINNKTIFSIINKIASIIYRNCDSILVTSHNFIDRLIERGINREKIGYLPNWFEEIKSRITVTTQVPQLPNGFKIMFAGNLGEGQNLNNVLQIIRSTQHLDIKWIFVGAGRQKFWAEQFVKDNSLSNNVFFTGRLPLDMMPTMYEKANVMLVSLTDCTGINDTLPAKVQSYMANSKPILCIANGEAPRIIREATCGWCINANNINGSIEVLSDIVNTDEEKLKLLGSNAKYYFDTHFTKEICMKIIDSNVIKL